MVLRHRVSTTGPAALKACGEEGAGDVHGKGVGESGGDGIARTFLERMLQRVSESTRRSPDVGLGYIHPTSATAVATASAPEHRAESSCGIPQVPSTLWNAMIAPLLPLHLAGFLWYQGETNADKPVLYRQCFAAMIKQWRQDFPQQQPQQQHQRQGVKDQQQQQQQQQGDVSSARGTENANTANSNKTVASGEPGPVPFLFVQLAPWPEQDSGLLPAMRYGQEAGATALPNVGMAVAADLGDSAGIFHPIHTPFKAEVGRRAGIAAEHFVFGNDTVHARGPQVLSVSWDVHDASWGERWHHGTPYGSTATACGFTPPGLHPGDPPATPWVCAGLQVRSTVPPAFSSLEETMMGPLGVLRPHS